jgi:hypothetical protein
MLRARRVRQDGPSRAAFRCGAAALLLLGAWRCVERQSRGSPSVPVAFGSCCLALRLDVRAAGAALCGPGSRGDGRALQQRWGRRRAPPRRSTREGVLPPEEWWEVRTKPGSGPGKPALCASFSFCGAVRSHVNIDVGSLARRIELRAARRGGQFTRKARFRA